MGGRSGRNAKSPAFQFYPGDFLADPYVIAMSMEERGIYLTLLCCAWIDGSIPNNPAILAPLCKLEPKRFAKAWAIVGTRFRVSESDPAQLVNPRLERERVFQADSKARRLAASKAANAAQYGSESDANRNVNGSDCAPVDPLTRFPIPEALLEERKTRDAREASLGDPEPDRPRLVTRRAKAAAAAAEKKLHDETYQRWQLFESRRSDALERAGKRGGMRDWPGVAKALELMAEQPEPAKRPA